MKPMNGGLILHPERNIQVNISMENFVNNKYNINS